MNWNSKVISEVDKERIWKEHVVTEALHRRINDKFSVNPFRIQVDKPISEPVNKRPNRFLDRDKALLETLTRRQLTARGEALPAINPRPPTPKEHDGSHTRSERIDPDQLSLVTRPPIQRYKMPLTETQEMHWLQAVQANQRKQLATAGGPYLPKISRFNYSKKSCEITKYAAAVQGALRLQKAK